MKYCITCTKENNISVYPTATKDTVCDCCGTIANCKDEIKQYKEINKINIDTLTYLVAHAPTDPQWGFDVPMDKKQPKPIRKKENSAPMAMELTTNIHELNEWHEEHEEKQYKMWPLIWAKEQLKQLNKY